MSEGFRSALGYHSSIAGRECTEVDAYLAASGQIAAEFGRIKIRATSLGSLRRRSCYQTKGRANRDEIICCSSHHAKLCSERLATDSIEADDAVLADLQVLRGFLCLIPKRREI